MEDITKMPFFGYKWVRMEDAQPAGVTPVLLYGYRVPCEGNCYRKQDECIYYTEEHTPYGVDPHTTIFERPSDTGVRDLLSDTFTSDSHTFIPTHWIQCPGRPTKCTTAVYPPKKD